MKLYDVEQTAKLLELSPLTIRKWLRSGKLKGQKIGKEWRISDEELKRLFPANDFFFDFNNKNPKMQSNHKLATELYPEKAEEYYWRENQPEPWDAFRDNCVKQIEELFPYPFKSDEIAYYNNDKTDYLEGGDPTAWEIYYSLRLKDEQKKFETLLNLLQEKYSMTDTEIDEIRRLADNIHLLTVAQPIFEDPG